MLQILGVPGPVGLLGRPQALEVEDADGAAEVADTLRERLEIIERQPARLRHDVYDEFVGDADDARFLRSRLRVVLARERVVAVRGELPGGPVRQLAKGRDPSSVVRRCIANDDVQSPVWRTRPLKASA
jgi:hypothetical protein